MYKLTSDEKAILKQAESLLTQIMENSPIYNAESQINTIDTAGFYLQNKIGCEEREHFVVLFLTTKNHLIQAETLFSGTINSSVLYPREVIKCALELNAAAIIVGHNHPSGDLEPSPADRIMTTKIKQACELMDIELLDHFIVSTQGYLSFADRNYL